MKFKLAITHLDRVSNVITANMRNLNVDSILSELEKIKHESPAKETIAHSLITDINKDIVSIIVEVKQINQELKPKQPTFERLPKVPRLKKEYTPTIASMSKMADLIVKQRIELLPYITEVELCYAQYVQKIYKLATIFAEHADHFMHYANKLNKM
jgi:hypothetical protein